MKKTLRPFVPHGTLRVQPSKSVLHRALICSALADGTSEIHNFAESQDITATMRVLSALGFARFECTGTVCTVHGGLSEQPTDPLDCGESGTTLRLLFPLALDGIPHTFIGAGRLLERPFDLYEDICRAQNIRLERGEGEIQVCGTLHSASAYLPGNVSSQFISGLLLGFSRTSGLSQILLTTTLESAPYVDLTCQVMGAFGANVTAADNAFSINGPQAFYPRDFFVEGDYSHAAFFAVAAALSGTVTLRGLRCDSQQGDRALFQILEDVGANIKWSEEGVTVSKGDLRPFEADVSQIPDLVPALAVLACGIRGHSALRNAARLRLKESDRLASMSEELTKLGARVDEQSDAIEFDGTGQLRGAAVHAHNDHRVAMALAAASLLTDGPVEIEGAESVSKSAPLFFQEWESIGGA